MLAVGVAEEVEVSTFPRPLYLLRGGFAQYYKHATNERIHYGASERQERIGRASSGPALPALVTWQELLFKGGIQFSLLSRADAQVASRDVCCNRTIGVRVQIGRDHIPCIGLFRHVRES